MYQLKALDKYGKDSVIFEAETKQAIFSFAVKDWGLAPEDADTLISNSILEVDDPPHELRIEESFHQDSRLRRILDESTKAQEEQLGDVNRAKVLARWLVSYANELSNKLIASDISGSRTSIVQLKGAIGELDGHVEAIAKKQGLPSLDAKGK